MRGRRSERALWLANGDLVLVQVSDVASTSIKVAFALAD